MHLDKQPGTMTNRSEINAERWCRFLVSVCYKAIGINLMILILVWFFYAFNRPDTNQIAYWVNFILLPSSVMLAINILADFLVRTKRLSLVFREYISLFLILFFCAFLCFVHSIVAVLLASFIVPVFVSTIFADTKITRNTFISALIFLILSGLKMNFFSTRTFGVWIGVEMLTACGLLIASYLLAKVFIVYGQDNISNLSNIYHDKLSLEEQLRLDPLTGLYNRKAHDEYLPQIMEECRVANIPLAIAVLDLDDFKQFNDVYGHAAGDRVLLRLADVLKRNLSEQMRAFRIGGEEFVLLFKGYLVGDAVKVCERMLSILSLSSLPEVEDKVITFSCGIAGMDENLADPVCLFKAADTALYLAKNSGKDKIMVHDMPI